MEKDGIDEVWRIIKILGRCLDAHFFSFLNGRLYRANYTNESSEGFQLNTPRQGNILLVCWIKWRITYIKKHITMSNLDASSWRICNKMKSQGKEWSLRWQEEKIPQNLHVCYYIRTVRVFYIITPGIREPFPHTLLLFMKLQVHTVSDNSSLCIK